MKYSLLLLCTILFAPQAVEAQGGQSYAKSSSRSVVIDKIRKDAQFFGGDSLSGFPIDFYIQTGVRKYPMYTELLGHLHQEEAAFIKKKYNIKALPGELYASAHRTSVPNVLTSSCNNLDFESGNFTGWTGGIGYNSNTYLPLVITGGTISTLGANSPETSCSFHTIVSGGTDPYGGFPMVDPGGGGFACRLGGELLNIGCDIYNSSSVVYPYFNPAPPNITSCTSNDPNTSNIASPQFGEGFSNGETIQQTFAVTSANCLFSYNYAVVISDAPHTGKENPYFSVQVYNQAGSLISCLSYFVEADTTGAGGIPPGFFLSPSMDQLGNSVLYRPWTQNSLNLQPYIGQNVTVKFTAAGCTQGGHFTYAYVDCSCGPLQLIAPSGQVCMGGTQSLVGPPAAGGTYSWSGPGIVGATTSQSVTCNQPGTYSVTITNTNGCAFTIDTLINFYPTPTVTVNNATVCPGNPATLNATSVGAGALNYTWTPSTGLSVTNDSTTTSTVNTTTSYTVTGISVNNCTNSAVAVVTVNSASPPTYSAAAVCLGSPTSITNTTSSGGSFSWNFGDGSAVVSNQNSPTHTYATTGTFVVSCTVNVGGCIGTNTANVVVNPLPVINTTGATICNGTGPVNISAGGANTYSWSTGGSGSSILVNPTTTTNYTVTGYSVNNCSVNAVVTVTVLPTPTLTTLGDTICSGTTASISANGATTYTWSGTNIISGNSANCTANPATTSIYTVTASIGTCTSSAVTTVSVLPTPSVTVSNQGPFCPGDPVPASSFTPAPNDPATTYQWTNNNPAIGLAFSGTAQTPSFTCNPNSTLANVQAVITVTPTLNGCTGLPSSYTITVKPTPLVLPGPDVQFCPNVMSPAVTFSCLPSGSNPTYFWTNLNQAIGLVGSGSGNLPSFSTVNSGSTVATATILVHASLNNCPGPDSVLVINVNPNPLPAFYFSSACLGTKTDLIDESSIGTGTITNWGWDFNNDGIFLDATNQFPSNIYNTAGPHVVGLQVTSNKGCKNSVYETVYVNAPPVIDFAGNNLSGCPVLAVDFTCSLTPGIKNYSWDFGNGETSGALQPTTVLYYNSSPYVPISYSVSLTVVSDSNCTSTITKNNYITVYPQPIAGFNYAPGDADILDPTIHFTNTSVGGSGALPIKYYFGDVAIGAQNPNNWSTLTNPSHTYNDQQSSTYYVTQWVKNVYGCRDSVTHPVTILPAFTFYIPNAFSPNGDNRNEGFRGTGIGIDQTTYNLWIFDRWGNEIWHSVDLDEYWDGTRHNQLVQEDVYVWKVRFSDIAGTKHEYHGTVSVVR